MLDLLLGVPGEQVRLLGLLALLEFGYAFALDGETHATPLPLVVALRLGVVGLLVGGELVEGAVVGEQVLRIAALLVGRAVARELGRAAAEREPSLVARSVVCAPPLVLVAREHARSFGNVFVVVARVVLVVGVANACDWRRLRSCR